MQNQAKNQNEVTVCVTKECALFLHNYRELKQSVLGKEEAEKPDRNFFVNFKGEPLAALQNTHGSLLNKAGKACNVPKANMTTVR